MPFDRQAVAALRMRVLVPGGPLGPLAAEAETLAEQARAAGDPDSEFELRFELLRLLAWQGEVAAAEPHLARLQALAPYRPGTFAATAAFALLAGDRRRAAAFCEEGWMLGQGEPQFLGNGVLLACWAQAERNPERLDWCVKMGSELAVSRKLSLLDALSLRAGLIDAALDLEDLDTADAQGRLASKHFGREDMPPLAIFLERRAAALVDSADLVLDANVATSLHELTDQAERMGWRVWLPALDAALALTSEV